MKEVFDFLKSCGVYYLATAQGDQPRVRPFTSLNYFEDKIYIQTGKVKPVAHQLKDNHKIEISGMAKGSWIRLTGEAVLDDNEAAQQSMLDANPGLEKMYAVGDGNIEVYYIRNAKADICLCIANVIHFDVTIANGIHLLKAGIGIQHRLLSCLIVVQNRLACQADPGTLSHTGDFNLVIVLQLVGYRLHLAGLDVNLILKIVQRGKGTDTGLIALRSCQVIHAAAFQKIKYLFHYKAPFCFDKHAD